jgi:hypothetical protein
MGLARASNRGIYEVESKRKGLREMGLSGIPEGIAYSSLCEFRNRCLFGLHEFFFHSFVGFIFICVGFLNRALIDVFFDGFCEGPCSQD